MKNILTLIFMAILIGCGSNNSSNSFSVSVGEDKISVLDKNGCNLKKI